MGNLFADLHKTVPQAALPPDANVFDRPEVQNHARALLEALQVIVWSVVRAGGKESTTIQDFVEKRIQNQLPNHARVALHETGVAMRQLRHLQALFEGVEDVLTDVVLEELPDEHCAKLEVDMQARANACVGGDGPRQIPLAPFVVCLRRFAFRYLRTLSDSLRPDQSLVDHLERTHLWPGGNVPPDFDKLLPRELLVRHTYCLLRQLQDRLQEREERERVRSHH